MDFTGGNSGTIGIAATYNVTGATIDDSNGGTTNFTGTPLQL